jgi:hypothetical protein
LTTASFKSLRGQKIGYKNRPFRRTTHACFQVAFSVPVVRLGFFPLSGKRIQPFCFAGTEMAAAEGKAQNNHIALNFEG